MKSFFLSMLTLVSLITGCKSTNNDHTNWNKRPLHTDHDLMMTLLDRPTPLDQQMMLAFINHKERQMKERMGFVNQVRILGQKQDIELVNFHQANYYPLIARDQNAIRVSGPK